MSNSLSLTFSALNNPQLNVLTNGNTRLRPLTSIAGLRSRTARCSASVDKKRFFGPRLRSSGSERIHLWQPGGPGRSPKLGVAVRSAFSAVPEKPQGLYDPAMDKDSCGVGFVAELSGQSSRKTVSKLVSVSVLVLVWVWVQVLTAILDVSVVDMIAVGWCAGNRCVRDVGAHGAQRGLRMRGQHWRWSRDSCGSASSVLQGGTFCLFYFVIVFYFTLFYFLQISSVVSVLVLRLVVLFGDSVRFFFFFGFRLILMMFLFIIYLLVFFGLFIIFKYSERINFFGTDHLMRCNKSSSCLCFLICFSIIECM